MIAQAVTNNDTIFSKLIARHSKKWGCELGSASSLLCMPLSHVMLAAFATQTLDDWMNPQIDRRTLVGGLAAGTGLLAVPSSSGWAAPLPPPPIAVDRVQARALSARDKRTRYAFGNSPPSGDGDTWPAGWGTDCSGFVAWCFGLGRWPKQYLPSRLSTDAIFLDAHRKDGSQLFVETADPKPWDIVIYPSYATLPLTYAQCELEPKYDPYCTPGHVAIISSLETGGGYQTIECASTPFNDPKIGDAIAYTRGDAIFTRHADEMAKVRQHYPKAVPRMTQAPVFARYLGLIR